MIEKRTENRAEKSAKNDPKKGCRKPLIPVTFRFSDFGPKMSFRKSLPSFAGFYRFSKTRKKTRAFTRLTFGAKNGPKRSAKSIQYYDFGHPLREISKGPKSCRKVTKKVAEKLRKKLRKNLRKRKRKTRALNTCKTR